MIKLFGQSQILKKDETLPVYRETVMNYHLAKPEKYEIVKFYVRGNVQPMGFRDLLMVPEHDRSIEQYWIFVNNVAYEVDSGLEIQGIPILLLNDRIERESKNFQVQSVADWGSFIQARIMLIDVGQYRTPPP